MSYLLIFIGSGLGGLCRFLMSSTLQRALNSSFPFGTFFVNMLGCFIIGFLGQLAESRGLFQGDTRLFLFVGILGGFTTFSSFGFETFQLLRDSEFLLALSNAFGQLALGLFSVWLGFILAKFF